MQYARIGWVVFLLLAALATEPAWADPGSAASPDALVPNSSFLSGAQTPAPRLSASELRALPDIGRYKCIPCCDPCTEWILTLPLWLPGVDATVGEGSVSVDMDNDVGDILDSIVDDDSSFGSGLDFAFVGQVAAHRGRWGMSIDAFHVALNALADVSFFDGFLSVDADAELKATIARFKVDYLYTRACLPWKISRCGAAEHRVYVGARGYDLAATANVLGRQVLDIADFWVDPIVGLESKIPFARNWGALVRADIGGFGIGSDWSWSLLLGVHWRFANRWGITAAWSVLDLRRITGSGADRTTWDINLSGPFVGISYFL